MVATLPPALIRAIPFDRLREALLWWLQASLERWPRRFTCRTPQGFFFTGCTRDIIQRFVYVYGVWEPELTEWVRDFLSPGDVALDVGANSGYHTLLLARCVGKGGRVIAVEPVPSIFALLGENLRLNDSANVTPILAAAGDAEGDIEIFRSDPANLGWSGSVASAGSVSEGLVPRRRLAELVDEDLASRVALIKIDTEGDELRVLRGMEELLERPGRLAVVVELTPEKLADRGQSIEETLGFLASYGFAAYRLEGGALVPLGEPPEEQVDAVFVRR